METIVKGTPPLIEEIYRRFPEVQGKVLVVYTHYPHVYKQVDLPLPPDLMIHEATHLRQQESDPQVWWDRYLKDNEFLISQEIEAYGAQYAYLRATYPRSFADKRKDGMASDLASGMYGNIISFTEAESKIRHYAKTVDTATLQALAERITPSRIDEGGAVRDSALQGVPESGD